MPRKAILINPPHTGSYRSKFMIGDSLALASVAQVLISKKIDVKIYDCLLHQWNISDIIENITDFDFVVITIMDYSTLEKVKEIITQILKLNQSAYITVGGAGPTLNPLKYAELNVNSIIVGSNLSNMHKILVDADAFFNQSLKIRNSIVININVPGCKNYDYPLIHRPDILSSYEMDRIVCLESSKGCYGSCKFCTVHFEYGRKWIPRSLENVITEIDYIKKALPSCTEIRFIDANFLGGGNSTANKRVMDIAKHLKYNDMNFRMECRINDVNEGLFKSLKAHGLTGIFFGVENGTQHILDKLNKNISPNQILNAISVLKDLQISYSYGFIMITPFSDDASIYENILFLKKIEFGLRWKHFFSGLILLKDNIFDVPKAQEPHELKLGYRCLNETCSKLLYFYEISLLHFLNVLELEHTIGLTIERGKESKDNRFWALDKIFSRLCLDVFENVFLDIHTVNLDYEDIYGLVHCHMETLNKNLEDILKKVKDCGLNESVMLKAVEERIRD